ncbi:hypothetical protein [Gimesia panareensis]|uniref:hypothetical protein n=1 Tax=Gimesia panareensis TaxID=2527978 RepID=UPI0011884043|nr:hypothetical protein [Gimesia panareensis]QDU50366.1 hypothetical protein Pan110_27120 [Gimesia panareensis]
MNSVSREPAGVPDHCPLCGAPVTQEMHDAVEQACCLECGCRIEGAALLLEFWERERTAIELSFSQPLTLETRLSELDFESLVLVELVMLLEGEVTVLISDVDDEALSQSRTVRELLCRLSHFVEGRGD